jgi:hypothetical protein
MPERDPIFTTLRFCVALALVALSVACTGGLGAPAGPRGAPSPGDGRGEGDAGTSGPSACEPSDAGIATPPPIDPLEASRVLRRIYLVLRGRPPLDDEAAPLDAATTDAEREAVLARAIDEGLASPDFYSEMVDFGHQWMRNGAYRTGAQGDSYMGHMAANLGTCDATTIHDRAWFMSAQDGSRGRAWCDDPAAPSRDVEAWWAPGMTTRLIGEAASTRTILGVDGTPVDCGIAIEDYYDRKNPPGCGCGPNAAWCWPGSVLLGGGGDQQRDMWDEPARLVAHLAWHDRALSDLVLANYTVATTRARALYLRFGRQTGLYNDLLDANATWFRPEHGSALRDPLHPEPTDARAWRELVVEELAPQLLSLSGGELSADPSRTFRWDPRTDSGPAPGLPASGVFTMPGMNSSFPRERPRAARMLEIFACREFTPPPADAHFPPQADDLARSGECMHCHMLMDPVAIAFRRWIFMGYYVPAPVLADMANLEIPDDIFAVGRRFDHRRWFRVGAGRWEQNWLPNTTMTPITEAELAANAGAVFLDTIPPEYTIFGEHTDGTMGPLAFAKVLVSSGEFDRCAARRIYERFIGRPLDPTTEGLYIETLAAELAAGGRLVRPFVRHLLESTEFRRGL